MLLGPGVDVPPGDLPLLDHAHRLAAGVSQETAVELRHEPDRITEPLRARLRDCGIRVQRVPVSGERREVESRVSQFRLELVSLAGVPGKERRIAVGDAVVTDAYLDSVEHSETSREYPEDFVERPVGERGNQESCLHPRVSFH